MKLDDNIFVAGHNGMVGSGIVRELTGRGFRNVITATRSELDLRDAVAVRGFMERRPPDYVFLAAAKVGGIQANINSPATFFFDNMSIQLNVLEGARQSGVKKLIFMGSSCVYPRDCPQPMKEDYLLTGRLEPTNEAYALAKLAGYKMSLYYKKQYGMDYLNVMPCNLYGTNDHYDPLNSHVLTALVKRFVDAVDAGTKEVTMWGTGSARREFMHVDDLVEAIFFLLEKWPRGEAINVGPGDDVSIRELATLIAEKAGYHGAMAWDATKPDGMPRKCLDVARLSALGYKPKISLVAGIEKTIEEYKQIKKRAAL